jgi:hypothetical protein
MRIRITESQYKKLFLGESTFNFDSNEINPSVSNEKKQKDSKLVQNLIDLSNEGKTFKNSKVPGKKIPFNSDVQKIQKALQFLGISLGEFGADGLFGKETELAIKEFQSKYSLPETGIISNEELSTLVKELRSKGYKDEIKPKQEIKQLPKETQLESRPKQLINFFVGKGLTPEQAAGIAGNIKSESNFKTGAIGDSGTSFGIAQWHANRGKKMKIWLKQNGYSQNDFKGQMEYLWLELQGSEKIALNKLKQTNTPQEAAFAFAKHFERCTVCSSWKGTNSRRAQAQNYFNSI